ncbi:hypothetical protein RB601_003256 [Gaeumannomyces tritici]
MVSPQNRGAFLVAAKARPLAVREAPYSPPGPGEVVVKNAAIALNPIDYAKQSVGNFLYSHIKYPFITGTDVAGVRSDPMPLGHALGMEKKHNKSPMCGFQLYTVLLTKMASPVPESIPLAARDRSATRYRYVLPTYVLDSARRGQAPGNKRLTMGAAKLGKAGNGGGLLGRHYGVKTKFVWGASLEDNEVGKLIYEDFLLGGCGTASSCWAIGSDLDVVQDGLDMLKEGVSASKLVVPLTEGPGV